MSVTIETDHRGPVVARLDRPPANALGHDEIDALTSTIDDLGDDQALVVTGRPGMFTGGLDLDLMRAGGDTARDLLAATGRLLVGVLTSRRPVVIAADGHGIAAGALLMLAADRTIVGDRQARFGFAEVPNGLSLPAGAVDLIAARVDPRAVLRLAVHGHLVGPAEAVAVGLAHRVVAPDDTVDAAIGEAAALATLPTDAYAETKRHVVAGLVERLTV